jgi:glycosyltransferase involved in cell wall biosynthesis
VRVASCGNDNLSLPVCSILCVTSSFPSSPGDREGNYIYHSLAALTKCGVDVSILVTRPYMPPLLSLGKRTDTILAHAFNEFSGIDTARYFSIPRNYVKRVSNASYDFHVGRAVERILERRGIDLIHGHNETATPVIARAAKARGIPAIVSLHGIDMCRRYMDAPAQRSRFRAGLNAMDRVILVGKPLWERFAALTGRDDHFRVVNNGFVPPPRDLCSEFVSRTPPHGRIEFISVSNLHEGKGVDITLDALAILNQRGFTGWRYRIVGDGDRRSELMHKVRSLGLGRLVEFLGARSHGDVYTLLNSAQVFVLPSYREAFGIAYLEAMALGLLAIGVRGQGPEAFLRDGESGFLVPPRDAKALATCLANVFLEPSRCHEISMRGRREALGHWTWAAHARRLLGVYDEVVRCSGS